MRICNFNDFNKQMKFSNKIFSCDEKTRDFLTSKGFFEVSTKIEDNALKYIFLYTDRLKNILNERRG